MRSVLWPLLSSYSWQELRRQPWRNAAAVLAVALGVALALSVHLINASALDEFSRGLRAASGEPDLEVHSDAPGGALDESLYGVLLHHPDVALASPVLELSSYASSANLAQAPEGSAPAARVASAADAEGTEPARVLLRLVGVDALQIAALAPELVPEPGEHFGRLDLFAPQVVFLNAAARSALGSTTLRVQQGLALREVRVAGSVRAAGAPLAVLDVAALQDLFGLQGQLSRVDLRLKPGVDAAAFVRSLQARPDWPASASLQAPGTHVLQVSSLSRAYRVNLTVLALIALFTGAFLVYSVLGLSVAQRAQQFALLGVLGMGGNERLRLVLLEAGVLGMLGSGLGVLLGTGLAAIALQVIGGDLGGGYFSAATPALQWSPQAAAVFALLGLAAALLGAWGPARAAQQLAPAQTLKGLGMAHSGTRAPWRALGLLLSGGALAMVPPLFGVPIAAYISVALLLLGGIAVLPFCIGALLDRLAPWAAARWLPLLAVERARRMRASAGVAVSGVVAALSLAVALTVMVASFRHSILHWLDTVLPASLYVRTAAVASAGAAAYFEPEFVAAAARIPGVLRVSPQRVLTLQLDATKPALTLLVRSLHGGAGASSAEQALPLLGATFPVPPQRVGVYVSEAVVDLYGARAGHDFAPLQRVLGWLPGSTAPAQGGPIFFVAGVWRDYARQFGSIVLDSADFARLSADRRSNELALWLTPQTDAVQVESALRALAARGGAGGSDLLEFGSATEIRARTLRLFDRSFAVTYWLQAVAIVIGLFGVAASFSAQVLARRKEFGLLAHLGLTRRQVLQVVAAEGAAWTSLGALAGVLLGLAVALVLVYVVNPQSFHWSMELDVPWPRLLALCCAVVLAGTVTAWLAGRAAASHDAVLAVREDW